MRLFAIVTAYHPDDRLTAVVESALVDCERVVVSDNTPAGDPSLAEKLDDPRVTVLRDGRNLGLGGALNRGLAALPDPVGDAADEAVLLLDQDSVLPVGLVRGLAAHLEADASIGAAAPTPWDEEAEAYYSSAGRAEGIAERYTVITSGMLLRRSTQAAVGPFREDFFVDFIDIEFCMRLGRTGAKIVQDWDQKLPHTMGERSEHRLGPWNIRVSHYPAWRHYWIARNSLRVNLDNFRAHPGALLGTGRYLSQRFLGAVLYMPPRGPQVLALARGVRDGLTGHAARRYLPAGAHLARPGSDTPEA
jgi:rhamnosyltransferase